MKHIAWTVAALLGAAGTVLAQETGAPKIADDPRIEFWLTGGDRDEDEGRETPCRLDGFYDPFPVDRSRVIPVERAREEDFDVLIAAHKSPPWPRSRTSPRTTGATSR